MRSFIEPWEMVDDRTQFVAELRREVPTGHTLKRLKLSCIARRVDCDDVLFEIEDGSGRFAVVHLTYSVETDSKWPRTLLYADFEEFVSLCMHPDSLNFVA